MSQNLPNFATFQKFQLDNLVDFEKCRKMLKNAEKRVVSCKDRCRYSRKRAKVCRNFANRRSRPSSGVGEARLVDEVVLRRGDVAVRDAADLPSRTSIGRSGAA